MEKVVHLFEIFETIFCFNFSEPESTFLIDQSLKWFQICLKHLNSDFV
jgi:hypothetical protein